MGAAADNLPELAEAGNTVIDVMPVAGHPGAAQGARKLLQGLAPQMGSLNEIFDAEPPYTPRGCGAQARSVVEMPRSPPAVYDGIRPARPHFREPSRVCEASIES